MEPLEAPPEQLRAIAEGRAFADLSAFRKVRITGADARAWLHDLVTCDVASLEPGRSRRTLLLTPTGRIRADLTVARDDDGFVLLQAPDQPDHVGLLLSPYLLSSDVSLHDATHELSLFSLPGGAAEVVARPGLAPSILGEGVDLLTAVGKPSWRTEEMFVKHDLIEVGPDAIEVDRIRRGSCRMGVDFDQNALPAEVGLEWTIDTRKGCFLGQESVARVRNLGHPPTVVVHRRARERVGAGIPVLADGVRAGTVTSAATEDGGGTALLARIRWESREASLATAGGAMLVPVPSSY